MNKTISRSSVIIEQSDGSFKSKSQPAVDNVEDWSRSSSELKSPSQHSHTSRISQIRISSNKKGQIGIFLKTTAQNGEKSSDSFETDSDYSSDGQEYPAGGAARKKAAVAEVNTGKFDHKAKKYLNA